MWAEHRMNEIKHSDRNLPWWPFAVGGMAGPLLSRVLTLWFPLPVAAGSSFFAMFFVATWLFEWRSGTSHRMARNLAASVLGSAVVGLSAFLFPW
jgi:hypothetical protein